MAKVTVMCDVCGGLVEGIVAHTDGYTGGFYLRGWVPVAGKGKQTDLFPEGKNIICDFDMQSSEAYKTLYGAKQPQANIKRAPARLPRADEVVRSYDELLTYIKNGAFDAV